MTTLQDSHEDGGETFTLTLSNASSGAVIGDGTATGTIENSDAMPQAWMARFGRTVAEQVLDAVEGRLRASRTAGVEMTLAGRGPAGLAPRMAAPPRRRRQRRRRRISQQPAASVQQEAAGLAAWLGDEMDPDRQRGIDTRAVSSRDLLTGSSFALTGGEARTGFYSLWGRAAVSRFDGREGELTVDGDVASGLLGRGLVAGPDRGRADRRPQPGRGRLPGRVRRRHGGFDADRRLPVGPVRALRAGLGVGRGRLRRGHADADAGGPGGDPYRPRPRAGRPAGLRGILLASAGGRRVRARRQGRRAGRADGDRKRVSGLGAADADVTRLRLGLEGSRAITFAGGATLTPSVEIGVRRDGGDAETGFGIDVGGGVAWSDPERGLSADIRGRGLLEPRGRRDPGTRVLGLARLGAGAGSTAKGRSSRSARPWVRPPPAAWTRCSAAGRSPGSRSTTDDGLANRRFELRFGYGFAAFGNRFTVDAGACATASRTGAATMASAGGSAWPGVRGHWSSGSRRRGARPPAPMQRGPNPSTRSASGRPRAGEGRNGGPATAAAGRRRRRRIHPAVSPPLRTTPQSDVRGRMRKCQ